MLNSHQEVTEQELKKAKEAVQELGVVNFINTNQDLIYRKLEDCDIRVFKAQKQQNIKSGESCIAGYECDIMFIADSLPLVTGIVNLGSETLNNAKQWVRELVPDADPISVLSALTLLYIAEKGYRKYQQDNTLIKGAEYLGEHASRKEVWKRIYTRVKKRFLP